MIVIKASLSGDACMYSTKPKVNYADYIYTSWNKKIITITEINIFENFKLSFIYIITKN